jgi:hypothetical protein
VEISTLEQNPPAGGCCGGFRFLRRAAKTSKPAHRIPVAGGIAAEKMHV